MWKAGHGGMNFSSQCWGHGDRHTGQQVLCDNKRPQVNQVMSKSWLWLIVPRGVSGPSCHPAEELALAFLTPGEAANGHPSLARRRASVSFQIRREGKQHLLQPAVVLKKEHKFGEQHLAPSLHSLTSTDAEHISTQKALPMTQLVALSRNGSSITGLSIQPRAFQGSLLPHPQTSRTL